MAHELRAAASFLRDTRRADLLLDAARLDECARRALMPEARKALEWARRLLRSEANAIVDEWLYDLDTSIDRASAEALARRAVEAIDLLRRLRFRAGIEPDGGAAYDVWTECVDVRRTLSEISFRDLSEIADLIRRGVIVPEPEEQ